MSVQVLVFPAPGVLMGAPGVGDLVLPTSATMLAVDKVSLLILAGDCVMAAGTTSFQIELNCLFTVKI